MLLSWMFIAGIGGFYWLYQAYCTVLAIGSIPRLEELRDAPPERWPLLSLIIPARNEELTVGAAAASRLADGYPKLEIVLVDDRSEDATGRIIDDFAAHDHRVKPVHITQLPKGWVGKVFAMQKGLEAASGGWLLFSDADIHIKPGTLSRVIAHAEAGKLDHVTLIPRFRPTVFLLDSALAVFLRKILFDTRAWEARHGHSDASIGAGAFNLVRRSALERTPGFEWLKMELADDLALGQMLKHSGARSAVINACGFVDLIFYRNLGDAARGSERAVFSTIGNFSAVRLTGISSTIWLLEMSPFLMMLAARSPWQFWSGLLLLLLALAICTAINAQLRRPYLPALAFPAGVTVMLVLIIRCGLLGKQRGGIYWRRTFYPTEELRKGRRYTLW